MSYYLYIIWSDSKSKYYVGETHNVEERFLKHINHSYSNSYTKIAKDWKLVLTFARESRKEAVILEKFIKRMKSKKFIEKIILNSEILSDILLKRK